MVKLLFRGWWCRFLLLGIFNFPSFSALLCAFSNPSLGQWPSGSTDEVAEEQSELGDSELTLSEEIQGVVDSEYSSESEDLDKNLGRGLRLDSSIMQLPSFLFLTFVLLSIFFSSYSHTPCLI